MCFAIVFCFSCVARRETESKQAKEEEEEAEEEGTETAAADEAVEASIIIAHEYSDIGVITLSLFAKDISRNVTIVGIAVFHSSVRTNIHSSTN